MVKVTIYQNRDQQLTGFDCEGHAMFSDENDIVCAAVSALVINCVNSIEELTHDAFTCDSCEADGMIRFRFSDSMGQDSQLLMRSLILGLQSMESNYEAYIDVIFEEV